MTTTLTPKELAHAWGSDARTVRKFIRSKDGMDSKVGKGQRWSIEAKKVKSLKTRFDAWSAQRAEKGEDLPDAPDALDAPDDEITE